MKTITYDDTLYQLVPKEATEIWCDGLLMSGYFSAHATRRVQLRHCKELISAVLTCSPRVPTPPAQPEAATPAAGGGEAVEFSHYKVVVDALSDLLGQVEQFCVEEGEADFETGKALRAMQLVCEYEYAHPQPQQVPLTEEQIEQIAEPFTRKLGGDHWYKGEEGIADIDGFARAIEAAHGITAAAPKQEPKD